MMTGETKALWFLAFLVVSGAGVRLWKARTPPPPEPVVQGLERQIVRVDSARAAREARGSSKTRRRPRQAPASDTVAQGPPELVDIDRATLEELDRLPGIGPALASRIVASRDSGGAFGGMDALCGVRGIGPALAKRLRPLVTFSGSPRLVSAACDGGSTTAENGRGARSRKPR